MDLPKRRFTFSLAFIKRFIHRCYSVVHPQDEGAWNIPYSGIG
ncbi:MAG: hypothetical protein K0R49_1341, partial [Burkholderiales bacterium]|nr:hypothetical protein [Burkholderiales bacterium]